VLSGEKQRRRFLWQSIHCKKFPSEKMECRKLNICSSSLFTYATQDLKRFWKEYREKYEREVRQ